jgi:hypothetical protein
MEIERFAFRVQRSEFSVRSIYELVQSGESMDALLLPITHLAQNLEL